MSLPTTTRSMFDGVADVVVDVGDFAWLARDAGAATASAEDAMALLSEVVSPLKAKLPSSLLKLHTSFAVGVFAAHVVDQSEI